MTGAGSQVWYSLHVYYHGPHDDLLCAGIGPVVAGLREAGAVRRAFFLRYWQGGPHVRLRCRLDAADRATTARIQAELVGYVARRPSRAGLDPATLRAAQHRLAALEQTDGDAEVVADNTVRPEAYVPEYGKYGGPRGVAVAEELFDVSSQVVWRLLPDLGARPQRRLGLGLSMMLLALRSAGLDGPDLVGFLGRYSRFWSEYAPPDYVATWPESLDRQRRALEVVATAALAGTPANEAAGRWAAAVADATARVDDGILAEITMAGPAASPAERRRFLVLNYVHTHNNRWGVTPAHEAFLAFLGHRVLADLLGLPVEPLPVAQSFPRAL